MRFKIEEYETARVRNIHGDTVKRACAYYIKSPRWFKSPRYLRLLPGWKEKLEDGLPCDVQLTSMNYATSFTTRAEAETVIALIKDNPDNFHR